MSFMDSYKRLEKLCGDVLNDDRRVSAYIDEMINTPNGRHLVNGWDEDLKQLKHYRWIRNKIVHEPDCTESDLCTNRDTVWIDDFYWRIMNQTDPLAQYHKIRQKRFVHNHNNKQEKPTENYRKVYHTKTDKGNNLRDCLHTSVAFLMYLIIAVVILYLWKR